MPITGDDTKTVLKILKLIPLMADLNETDHLEIIKRITLEYFPKDYFIFHENDGGNAFYIIKRGIIRIFHENTNPDREKEVEMLGDNDFFGEMALISEKPRNATAKTVEESEVFKLTKDDFMNLVGTNPNMAGKISSEFLTRLKANIRAENA
jgi:CRP-like cAMP-binding protein